MVEGLAKAPQFSDVSFRVAEYRNAFPIVKRDELLLGFRPIQISPNLIQQRRLLLGDEIGLREASVGSNDAAGVNAAGSRLAIVSCGSEAAE